MLNFTRSNLFTKETGVSSTIINEPDNLESLVSPYFETEIPFEKVNRNFRYAHSGGLVFDAFKEQAISFEVVPLYYLKGDTPAEVLEKLKQMPGIVTIAVEPEEGNEQRLCYSDVGSGAPILVGSKISDYYIGKKYHQKIKGIQPVYKYADFSDNQLRGALAVIEKTRGVNITQGGGSRLYEASLRNDLYQACILKGGTRAYTKDLLFQTYELMCNLGHPSKYKVTVLEGIYLPKTDEQLTFEFSVDNTSFGEDLDKALIFATENCCDEIKITCSKGVVAKLGFRKWKFIKHAVAALSKVDFNQLDIKE